MISRRESVDEHSARADYSSVSSVDPTTSDVEAPKANDTRASEQRDGKSLRKVDCATPTGRQALEATTDKIREFISRTR